MALQLFRLASDVPVATNTNYAYFRPMSANISLTNGVSYTLAVGSWFKGDGTAATAFVSASGYNLSINGVLQQSGLYTVTSDSLTLTAASSGITISLSAPMTLEANITAITPAQVAVP